MFGISLLILSVSSLGKDSTQVSVVDVEKTSLVSSVGVEETPLNVTHVNT